MKNLIPMIAAILFLISCVTLPPLVLAEETQQEVEQRLTLNKMELRALRAEEQVIQQAFRKNQTDKVRVEALIAADQKLLIEMEPGKEKK